MVLPRFSRCARARGRELEPDYFPFDYRRGIHGLKLSERRIVASRALPCIGHLAILIQMELRYAKMPPYYWQEADCMSGPDKLKRQTNTAVWKQIVAKYQEPSTPRAVWQIVNTLGPYALIW